MSGDCLVACTQLSQGSIPVLNFATSPEKKEGLSVLGGSNADMDSYTLPPSLPPPPNGPVGVEIALGVQHFVGNIGLQIISSHGLVIRVILYNVAPPGRYQF